MNEIVEVNGPIEEINFYWKPNAPAPELDDRPRWNWRHYRTKEYRSDGQRGKHEACPCGIARGYHEIEYRRRMALTTEEWLNEVLGMT